MKLHNFYYLIKPFLPRYLQIKIRQKWVQRKRSLCQDIWPIDPKAGISPRDWQGWPEGKIFSFVLTHDVETEKGQGKVKQLAEIEMKLGFRSSFNFVPEGYKVSAELREWLVKNDFEVGVHGLTHDGKLYSSRKKFLEKVKIINKYIVLWKSYGFRSPSMHHNLEWLHDLNIEYDASTFDTDPFEPQSDSVCTIFPFYIAEADRRRGYVELPYTLPQDFCVFILMGEKTTNIWKRKLEWISDNRGMALLNTHPDYMAMNGEAASIDTYPIEKYVEFLTYVKKIHDMRYWNPLPKDVAQFIKTNFKLFAN